MPKITITLDDKTAIRLRGSHCSTDRHLRKQPRRSLRQVCPNPRLVLRSPVVVRRTRSHRSISSAHYRILNRYAVVMKRLIAYRRKRLSIPMMTTSRFEDPSGCCGQVHKGDADRKAGNEMAELTISLDEETTARLQGMAQ